MKRPWIGLAVLALPTLLLSIDASVLYLALPQISAQLGADGTEQLWILDIYSFLLAGLLVTMGTLGDRIGRRRLLLIGAGGFGVTSVLAAYAPTPELLIVARALLGVAGATLMPSTMALIRTLFPDPRRMAAAISIWFACFMGGMTIGPLVGGALLEHFWWGSAFLLGVPFMVVLLLAGPFLLPESKDSAAGRLDLVSAALSLATILPAVYGLKELARSGWDLQAAAAIALGVLCGVVFFRRQQTLRDPLLDVRLFRIRAFSTGLSVMLTTGIVMAGISLLIALYLQGSVGLSPLEAGLMLIPQNIAMITGSLLAPVVSRRLPLPVVMSGGLVLGAVGLFLIAGVGATDGQTLLITGISIACFGIAMPLALTNTIVLGAAPPEKAGSAASMSETGAELGIALGVATIGSVAGLIYRVDLAGTPLSVPAEAVEAAGSGITTAGVVAAQLPGPMGTALFDAARASFALGLNTVAVVGAVAYLVLAGLAVAVLRSRPAGVAGNTDRADPVVGAGLGDRV